MNGDRDCLAYAEHLQAEHRGLHQRLRALQRELGEVTQPYIDRPLLARILEAGRELRKELAHHFAEEENGGCLDYAVSRMPRLAGEAQLVENEHPVLLEELDAMLAHLGLARPGELETATVKEQFDAFVVRMLTHEARENQLVERGFNMAFDDE